MTRAGRQLRDAIATMESAGKSVRGLRIHPNGVIDILTEAPSAPPVANDDGGDWVDLAGETTVPSATRP